MTTMRGFQRALRLAACLSAVWAAAAAQDASQRYVSPQYFVVGDLPPGETLTIRSAPSADAEELGALEEGAGPLEVVAVARTGQTDWAEIGYRGDQAYVALRFLDETTLPTVGASALPVGAVCSGTEPFWSIEFLSAKQARFDALSADAPETYDIGSIEIASGRFGWPAAMSLASEERTAELVANIGWCSDGMSNRDYPWTVSLIVTSRRPGGERIFFEGCCAIRTPQ